MSYQGVINQMTQVILENIKIALEKNVYCDRTFKGMVVKILDQTTYVVMNCGKNYTVSSSITYNIGDYVRVCAPCNNWDDLFIVCKTK